MPKACIIELSASVSEPTITESSGHGNQVRTAFLANAPVGWTADVVDCPLDYGVKAYEFVEANASNYSLALCSYETDLFYTRNFDKIPRLLGMPFFQPMPNSSAIQNAYYQKANITFTGGGTTSNVRGRGQRIDTFDVANAISPNNTTTSWVNGVIAGKAAHLVDAGLTASQVYKAIRQSLPSYPTWTQDNGWGKAPDAFTVPTSYDLQPPLGVSMARTGGTNLLRLVFARITGDPVEAIIIYQNGVPTYTVTQFTPTIFNTELNTFDQFNTTTLVLSEGGTLTFNASCVINGVESRIDPYNERTITGFTNNYTAQTLAPKQEAPTLFLKRNRAVNVAYQLQTNVNVSLFPVVRLQSETITTNINVISSDSVRILANATTTNVASGYTGFTIEGQTPNGWQAIESGTLRIDK